MAADKKKRTPRLVWPPVGSSQFELYTCLALILDSPRGKVKNEADYVYLAFLALALAAISAAAASAFSWRRAMCSTCTSLYASKVFRGQNNFIWEKARRWCTRSIAVMRYASIFCMGIVSVSQEVERPFSLDFCAHLFYNVRHIGRALPALPLHGRKRESKEVRKDNIQLYIMRHRAPEIHAM